MKVTNQKLHDYLMDTARTYNTGFFPSGIYMEISLSKKTDVEMLKFFIKAGKNIDNVSYFEGNSGAFVKPMDAYQFLARFDEEIKFDNSEEEANKLIDEFYKLAE